jgi:hypothetical protein
MTPAEISALERRIAEKVFGYAEPVEVSRARSLKSAEMWDIVFTKSPPEAGFGDYSYHVTRDGTKIYCGNPHQIHYCPRYTLGADFQSLLAKCAEKCGEITIAQAGDQWRIYQPGGGWTNDRSLPLALAKFAAALFDPTPKT